MPLHWDLEFAIFETNSREPSIIAVYFDSFKFWSATFTVSLQLNYIYRRKWLLCTQRWQPVMWCNRHCHALNLNPSGNMIGSDRVTYLTQKHTQKLMAQTLNIAFAHKNEMFWFLRETSLVLLIFMSFMLPICATDFLYPVYIYYLAISLFYNKEYLLVSIVYICQVFSSWTYCDISRWESLKF
jgi:hypothetical protein